MHKWVMPRAGTHCNTLQHTATLHLRYAYWHMHTWVMPRVDILQQTATNYNTLQHTATHYALDTREYTADTSHATCWQTVAHCNTLSTLRHNTLQRRIYTATHCTALLHTATHCNTLQRHMLERRTYKLVNKSCHRWMSQFTWMSHFT